MMMIGRRKIKRYVMIFSCPVSRRVERYGHEGYLIKVVVMALAEEVTREPSPILSWSNNNYEI